MSGFPIGGSDFRKADHSNGSVDGNKKQPKSSANGAAIPKDANPPNIETLRVIDDFMRESIFRLPASSNSSGENELVDPKLNEVPSKRKPSFKPLDVDDSDSFTSSNTSKKRPSFDTSDLVIDTFVGSDTSSYGGVRSRSSSLETMGSNVDDFIDQILKADVLEYFSNSGFSLVEKFDFISSVLVLENPSDLSGVDPDSLSFILMYVLFEQLTVDDIRPGSEEILGRLREILTPEEGDMGLQDALLIEGIILSEKMIEKISRFVIDLVGVFDSIQSVSGTSLISNFNVPDSHLLRQEILDTSGDVLSNYDLSVADIRLLDDDRSNHLMVASVLRRAYLACQNSPYLTFDMTDSYLVVLNGFHSTDGSGYPTGRYVSTLGDGASGVAQLAVRISKTDPEKRAVVVVKLQKNCQRIEDVKLIYRETEFHRDLQGHNHILGLHNSGINSHNSEFVHISEVGLAKGDMDFRNLKSGDPRHIVRQNLQRDIPTFKSFSRQLCLAVSHMASLGIMHRDIKPANILMGVDGDVKLSDFGLATKEMDGKLVGTSGYLPLDLEGVEFQNLKTDVFMVGVTIAELGLGMVVPSGDSFDENRINIQVRDMANVLSQVSSFDDLEALTLESINSKVDGSQKLWASELNVLKEEILFKKDSMSMSDLKDMVQFISLLLSPLSSRPSIQGVLEHPFLQHVPDVFDFKYPSCGSEFASGHKGRMDATINLLFPGSTERA
jgi:serine/threonine protein kinase